MTRDASPAHQITTHARPPRAPDRPVPRSKRLPLDLRRRHAHLHPVPANDPKRLRQLPWAILVAAIGALPALAASITLLLSSTRGLHSGYKITKWLALAAMIGWICLILSGRIVHPVKPVFL